MDDLLDDFIAETLDGVTTLDGDLVHLEKMPRDQECLARIFRVFHSMKGACGFLGLNALGAAAHNGECILEDLRNGVRPVNTDAISDILLVTDRVKDIVSHLKDAPKTTTVEPVLPKALADSVRVRVHALDRVMDTMSELSILRHQPVTSRERFDAAFDDLQSSVLHTRLMPFDSLWRKLPRLVRDLAHDLKKEVALDMTGGVTEIDRPILDKLEEMIVHLMRNALDHGIESPEERQKQGKNPRGLISLQAKPENGAIVVTFSDDGRGLDPQRLLAQAIRKNLLTAEQARNIKPHEAIDLIFHRGFSTADQISSVSGRGIGMDVVRDNLNAVGGSIQIASEPGHGTTITLTVPLTLAVMPCLMIDIGKTTCALPLRHVRQLVACADHLPVMHWQDHIVPLLDIQPLLNLPPSPSCYAAILQCGARLFAIHLTALHDVRDIVVKSLPPLLRESGFFSGQTLLGDGGTAFILEPNAFLPFLMEAPHDGAADVSYRHA